MNETMSLAVLDDAATARETSVPDERRSRFSLDSKALLVLGMHRSGTSALAGILNTLGIELGQNLMPASPDNPKGYFEHQDIVAVHDGLLSAIGSRWDSVRPMPSGWADSAAAETARTALGQILLRDFAGRTLWGLKDPRLCRLMPLWRPLFQTLPIEPRYILMMRRPAEVAASLAARDRLSAARARMLWLRYVLEAEAATRGEKRTILHYHDLIENADAWPRIVNRMARELELEWPISPSTAAPAISDLLTPQLWHYRSAERDGVPPPALAWIDAVEHAFIAGDGPALHDTCDRITDEIEHADQIMGEHVAELERGIAMLMSQRPQAAAASRQAPPIARGPAVQSPAPGLVADPEYAKWLARRASAAVARDDWVAEQIARWQTPLKFAFGLVLPAGTEARLVSTLQSLQKQRYNDWQLHVIVERELPAGFAPDHRLFCHASEGQPITMLNRVLAASDADWVGLIDGGDRLAPEALFVIRIATEKHPEWTAFYTDEDRIDAANVRADPQFKPDFNLDLMRSMPYVGGLLAMRHATFAAVGGFDRRWDGLEECDLALRLAEGGNEHSFGHIADVLYHRFNQSGRSHRPVAEICTDLPRLVQAHLDRMGVKGKAEQGFRPLFCRVRYEHDGPKPLVSIVIPTKNQLALLKRCVETVLRITEYENYEVIIVDNGSTSHDAIEYLRLIDEKVAEIGTRLRVLRHPGAFNFSAMNNHAVREARGEYVCLLNNDAAPLDGEWLAEMMQHARRPEVGVVGAKLFYPNGRIQHGGVILGIGWGSAADHPYNGAPGDAMGYWGRLQAQQDFSAVTAACMVTRRSLYQELGGLDEEAFAVCFNDVDYCLRVRQKGYLVAWTPYAKMLHETSASLRSTVEDKGTKEKGERFAREKGEMYRRWMPMIAFDPAYNRNLTSTLLGFTTEEEGPPTWDPNFRPRPRVLVHPADREGCGEYRMIAPSRALFRAGVLHSYETMRLMSPPELARMEPESIILQRQLEFPQINGIRLIKQFKKAFRVFELDDLITNLPVKSAYRPLISDDIGQRLQQALALCNRLVVSTEPLARRYGKLCDEVVVVQNRLEGARWKGIEGGRRVGGKPRVGWAGAVGHTGDLALITGVLEATHREVDWVFFGMCPKELTPYVAEFHDWVPLANYPRKLASLDLDLAIAPLEYNPFNEAKSNLRLLEYGVVGYPVICTDILPYQCGLPVTRLKNRHRDWIKTILDMVADRDACRREGEKLRQAVLAEWMMEDHLNTWRAAWLP
jgi:O-antigen biosynthesis protein